jgi:hypothetical protein
MEPRFTMNRCLCVVASFILIVSVAACDTNGTVEPSTTATSTTRLTTTTSASTATTTSAPVATKPATTTTTAATTSTTTTTTTTVPADVTPPELVITAPHPGETVTTRTYRFAGTTDPGCTVTAASRYAADVDDDGNWSIILVLNPGGNLATFTATDPAGNTTTAKIGVTYVAEGPPPILVADEDGIRVIGEGAWGGGTILVGRPVALAVPDLLGGVMFQGPQNEIVNALGWDEDFNRYEFIWAEGGPEPIWRIAGPDHPPQPLITSDHAKLTLVDVVELDGRPQVLYRMRLGGTQDPDTAAYRVQLEWLCLYDIMRSETRILGLIEWWDSSDREVRLGGGVAAAAVHPFSEGVPLVGFLPVSELGEWVDGAFLSLHDYRWFPFGPAAACPEGTAEYCETWVTATAASDGSRVSWVEGGWSGLTHDSRTPLPVELVTADVASGAEMSRVTLDDVVPVGDRPTFIDDNGSFIVVSGFDESGETLLVTPEGEVISLGAPGATASFWESSPSTSTPMIEADPPVVLAGNGLGVVAFGTPIDEALQALETALGPVSRTNQDFYHYYYWDNLSLSVSFDDGPFYRDDGVEHLVAWSRWDATTAAVHTSAGIGLGATFEELVAAHGDQVEVPPEQDECLPTWYVWLNDPSANHRLLVAFDDDPLQGGRISYMSAGAGEGC